MDIKHIKNENIKLKRLLNNLQPYYDLLNVIEKGDLDIIFQKSLDICKNETDSFQGFIGLIKNDSLYIPTFRNISGSCKVKDKVDSKKISKLAEIKYLYENSIKSGEIYFTNGIDIDRFISNTPEGHIKITNFLSVPIKIGNQILGIIALANSTFDYDDNSINKILKVSNLLALILNKEQQLNQKEIIESVINSFEKDFFCIIDNNKILYANNLLSNFMIDNYSIDMMSLPDLSYLENIDLTKIIINIYKQTIKSGKYKSEHRLKLINEEKTFEAISSPIITDDTITGASILLKDLTSYKKIIEMTKKDYNFEKFISELLQEIFKKSDLKKGIYESIKKTGEYLGISNISIYILNREKAQLLYDWSINNSIEEIDTADSIKSIVSKVREEGMVVAYKNTSDSSINEYFTIKNIFSLVSYPLIQKGEIFGIINYEEDKFEKIWSIREIELLKIISNVLASAIVQKKAEEDLKYASTHDKMTSIYNRAYFETEVERLKSSRNFPISIFIVDVNDLKYVNDNIGHTAGDDLIINAARILKASIRGYDCLARIGGDEFAILAQNSDEKIAKNLFKRILLNQDEMNKTLDIKVSMAVGYAVAHKKEEVITAIKKADENMYKHKKIVKGNKNIR